MRQTRVLAYDPRRHSGRHAVPLPFKRRQRSAGPCITLLSPMEFTGRRKWSTRTFSAGPTRTFFPPRSRISFFTSCISERLPRKAASMRRLTRLDDLKELGINAIEIMPVAQFAATRNWGYDGVYLFAPQNSYGGPEGMRRLIDACHARGISGVPRRGVQPLRSRGELPCDVRPVLYRSVSYARGEKPSTSTMTAAIR